MCQIIRNEHCIQDEVGTWDGSIADLECSGDGDGDALLVTNDGEGVNYSLVAFSAGMPGGIHLSQFPGAYARRWGHLTWMGGRKPWTASLR